MNPNPDPTPSASGDFLPIASYDRALHGEWVEGRWGDAFDLSTTRFNEGKWWVGRDNPSREIEVPTPSRFRPVTPPNFPDLFRAQHPVATPPASGETEDAENCSPISNIVDRLTRDLTTSRAECEALRRERDEREQQLVNKIAELDARIAQASALLLASAEPFDKACAILKS